MELNTVIFDIDGLLIDSEPLWQEAAYIVFKEYGMHLTEAQYITTTGLRTKEFVEYWFHIFKIAEGEVPRAVKKIIATVLELIDIKGRLMAGVPYIFEFFKAQQFKIGIATSSPTALIDLVVQKANLTQYVQAAASAEDLLHGKPHPQVYLNCAEQLRSNPLQCICFEDSFNGMIAVKAARMKCVIVPHPAQAQEARWSAADLKLTSLQNFGQLLLDTMR